MAQYAFFLVIIAVSACLVMAILIRAFYKAAPLHARTEGIEQDVAFYKAQLADLDSDVARGTLSPDDAAAIKLTLSRRLLSADQHIRATSNANAETNATAAAEITAEVTTEVTAANDAALVTRPRLGRVVSGIIGSCILGACLLYFYGLGFPGYQDLPISERLNISQEIYKNRPSQEQAEAQAKLPPPVPQEQIDPEFANLMEQLRTAVHNNPDDPRGWALLSQNEALLGNIRAAKEAQEKYIALRKDTASAEDYTALAEILIFSAGGLITSEAEKALQQALAKDPEEGGALYYMGELYNQVGRYDRAFTIWRHLLENSSADAPWSTPIRARIGDISARAGVTYTPPSSSPLRGPSQQDIAAAADMSAEDRQAMIEGMTQSLSERLATQGGSAEEWARLITSLGVLGKTEQAAQIYAEAQQQFASDAGALKIVEQAAQRAGLKKTPPPQP